MAPLQKTKSQTPNPKQLLKAEARQIKTEHEAIGFITEGSQPQGTLSKELRAPPLPELHVFWRITSANPKF